MLSLGTHYVYASVEMNAYLPINGDPTTPSFTFSRTITLDYPNGGKLKNVLDGKNFTFGFGGDSEDPAVKSFMDQLNTEIRSKSQVTITHLTVDYHVLVHGNSKQASFDYTLTLRPTIIGYILNKGIAGSPTLIDTSWIGFDFKEPVVIKSYEIEINYPENSIKNVFPDVYNILKGTNAENALRQNLIDSNQLLRTNQLDSWNSLFDPAYSLTPTLPLNQFGIVVPVTTFTTDLNSLQREHSTTILGAEFSFDRNYHLDITEKPNIGTINVQGHANLYNLQGNWTFSTTENPTNTGAEAPVGTSYNVIISVIILIAAGITALLCWFVKRGFSYF